MKVKNIRVDHVFVSEFNCRKNLDDLDIENLANSIKKYGLFQNIVVFKKGKNLYELIIGQRRLLAFKFLRRKTIPAKILEEVDDLDALAISLQEDIHKVGLTPLDKARSFRTLYKLLGEDVSRVAAKVAKSIQTVRNYLKMLKIEGSVQKKIDQGRIKLPVRTLVQVPDLPKDKQEIVAEHIQNYPGEVQRTIMRELKANPAKLKIIEQKELMANFIRKVITFRLPRLQDVSRRFFDDLREIEHIQNYPGEVQRTIMRELKANPAKLKIIEQKELMANFIRKVIIFRWPLSMRFAISSLKTLLAIGSPTSVSLFNNGNAKFRWINLVS
ncbi:unnamed protein product [marine sediment metagenome]|uniref:ParB-like N-terminal domain-containing protein n=1 Tax=marine sediment metagenome TaxID=412755 RepID=X1FY07_9ZZZZ